MCAIHTGPLSALELCETVRRRGTIDAARLDRILAIDSGRGLVEVQAGASWKSLARHLRPSDADAACIAARGGLVGDTIARNAAGPDGNPAVAHVESLTLVLPDGNLRKVDRLTHADLFALAVGGHGLFGVLYSATLRLQSLLQGIRDVQASERITMDKTSIRKIRLLLPPAALRSFVDDARACCAEWRVPIAAMSLRHIHKEEETYLRWARADFVAVTLALGRPETLGSAVRITQLTRELIDAVIARGGSFPIADTSEATRSQTLACYPELTAFLAEHRRLDPDGRFENAWSRHQRSLLEREPCDVRWNHYAEA